MEKLNDITECCICKDSFTDPRMLPCIHTFCLKCLQEFESTFDKGPGDTISCPICRKEFTIIPTEGFDKIQKNFFVEKFVEIAKVLESTEKPNFCDVCKRMEDENVAEVSSSAKMFCIDCRENLCSDCTKRHRLQKLGKDHRVVEIGSKISKEDFDTMFKPLTCDQHPSQILNYYCVECKKVVCVSCFVESHKTHTCSDVNKVSEEFCQGIGDDIKEISTNVALTSGKIDADNRERERFLKI